MVSFRITKGNIQDTKKFSPLVREAAEKYDFKKYMQTKRMITKEETITY